jgi:hypothetical protein
MARTALALAAGGLALLLSGCVGPGDPTTSPDAGEPDTSPPTTAAGPAETAAGPEETVVTTETSPDVGWIPVPDPPGESFAPIGMVYDAEAYYLPGIATGNLDPDNLSIDECALRLLRYDVGTAVWDELPVPEGMECGSLIGYRPFPLGDRFVIEGGTEASCELLQFEYAKSAWSCLPEKGTRPGDGFLHSTGELLVSANTSYSDGTSNSGPAIGADGYFHYSTYSPADQRWTEHQVELEGDWDATGQASLQVRGDLGLLLPAEVGQAMLLDIPSGAILGSLSYAHGYIETDQGSCNARGEFAGAMWDGMVPVLCGQTPMVLDLRTGDVTPVAAPAQDRSCFADVADWPSKYAGFEPDSDFSFRPFVYGCALYDPTLGGWSQQLPTNPEGFTGAAYYVVGTGASDTLLACGTSTAEPRRTTCLRFDFGPFS